MRETIRKFTLPGGITDSNQNPALIDDWNRFLYRSFEREFKSLVCAIDLPLDQALGRVSFFNPLKPPSGQLNVTPVTWGGFPNVLTATYGQEEALKMADSLRSEIYYSADDTDKELELSHRPQDEYLEWVVHNDKNTGKIKEIIFTCEGPEYWQLISKYPALLLSLYREYASAEVELSELIFSHDVYKYDEDKKSFMKVFKKGDYNRYNKWNLSSAIHLTQPNNTLGAEINLAARATVLRSRDNTLITDSHALICCAGYGEANRNSDPTIGSAVNSLVRDGNWVSIRDPVGLYIIGIDSSQFTKPDHSPIPDFENRYWNVVRGNKEQSMILRASLRVPDEEVFNGKPLVLDDLLVNGRPLRYGGQVASKITVGLYAISVPGASKLTPIPCPYKCCPHPRIPNIDTIEPIDKECSNVQELHAGLRTKVSPIQAISQFHNSRNYVGGME